MQAISTFNAVYLCKKATDMRKRAEGLSAIVEQEMHLSPFERHLFVFINKRRDMVALLYWRGTGFAYWSTRLQKDRFKWPSKEPGDVVSISPKEMELLLDGYDIVRMKPHKTLHFETTL